jgi:hypothetical protein
VTNLHPKDLRPGDVLLSRGTSPLADLIADIDPSGYSHAAYWTGMSVIEATIRAGVAQRDLAESVADVRHVDVYRFFKREHGEDRWLGSRGWEVEPVQLAAQAYLARPYAYDQILTLAAVLAFGPEPSPAQQALLMQRIAKVVPPRVRLEDLLAKVPENAVICTGMVAGTFWDAGEQHAYALEVALPAAARPQTRSARGAAGQEYAALRSRMQGALAERFGAPPAGPRRGRRSVAATVCAGDALAPVTSITLAQLAQSPTLRKLGRLTL